MTESYRHLLRALGEPATMTDLTPAQWTGLVAIAREAQLLARLAALARRDSLFDRIPEAPARHLEAAHAAADKHARDIRWELTHLGTCLGSLPGPALLLKGAAYATSGVAAHLGRTFGDIDVIVPRAQLDAAEHALEVGGWRGEKQNAYDIQYYRRWTHQLPPMRHQIRQSVIDLHHALRPPIAPGKVDISLLFADARPAAFGLQVPCPADMVIHSATHLFCAIEFRNGLRDLSDIDLLLREFGTSAAWWDELVRRARHFGLVQPVAMALLHCRRVLGTPVPPETLANALRAAGRGERRLLDGLVSRVLPPPRYGPPGAAAARAILFVRGYLLDMPPTVLAAHLTHKLLVLMPGHRTAERHG